MEYIPLGKTGVAAGLICKNFAVNLNVAIQVVLVCVVTIDAAFDLLGQFQSSTLSDSSHTQ